MHLPKNFETSVFVLLILATQKQHLPLKSTQLSNLLQVSDSSLKKTLRKLVVADLISSDAKRDGGFTLKKPITKITLANVLLAVEDEQLFDYESSTLATTLFPHLQHVQQSEQLISQTLDQGAAAFTQALQKVTLDQLLETDTFQSGVINWQARFESF
ncbi:Rrf2 family transcriptional regulator [Lapidilactobacillus bayanensis]|uniref:Rrf2 family transcriptional regulator n=1 Tax=Lapidilactobacillus bayanensis TaxID=2485998 RepID=UPI000F798170|nr:Rrf2 family transcriptional regulator [Lapidilactobacillus bayanensis]